MSNPIPQKYGVLYHTANAATKTRRHDAKLRIAYITVSGHGSANDPLAGGSERPLQNTHEEGLDAGPADPGRYTVRAAGGSGAAANGDARTVLALVGERADASADDASSDRLGFRWLDMLKACKDLEEEILQHVSVEVGVTEQVWRTRPADMAASLAKYRFLVAGMAAHPLLFSVNQEYLISRARTTPFRWGRLLTHHVW